MEKQQVTQRQLQGDVKRVQDDMLEIADSLVCIKNLIHAADYKNFIHDLVPPMLDQRVEWIRIRARELFRDLGVKEPQPDQVEES